MNLPTVTHEDCDLCDQDLARLLQDLEEWGQAQRRDAVRALLESLPEHLLLQVTDVLPWVPDPVVDLRTTKDLHKNP